MTSNIFVDLKSNDKEGGRGLALKSLADITMGFSVTKFFTKRP